MSADVFDTPEFRKLQREWYAKLKADGFDDIERHNLHDDNPLMRRHKHEVQITVERGARMGREEYFRRAGHWSWDRTFPDRRAAHVWRLHAVGVPYREIAKRVAVIPACKPSSVFYVIEREAQAMVDYYKHETVAGT